MCMFVALLTYSLVLLLCIEHVLGHITHVLGQISGNYGFGHWRCMFSDMVWKNSFSAQTWSGHWMCMFLRHGLGKNSLALMTWSRVLALESLGIGLHVLMTWSGETSFSAQHGLGIGFACFSDMVWGK